MDNGAGSYRRFLEGDDNGIVEIVRDFKDGLILYLNSYVVNIHVAEDLAEDTFFRLITRRPRFREKYSFKTWLYTIGRNVAIDYIRKHSRMVPVSDEDMDLLARDEESLETSYLREAQKITLHRALEGLKPQYHQILYLLYFEDFSMEQAAAAMKMNKHQAETLAYRARNALREELKKEGQYERL